MACASRAAFRHASWAAAFLLCCVTLPARSEEPCRPGARSETVAAGANDARSIRLADGRELRLAGLAFIASSGTSGPAIARQATRTLDELVRGQTVVWHAPKTTPDRYGRIAAYVFVNHAETPVQYNLLAKGLALVGAGATDADCRMALLREENAARTARLGLWSGSGYALAAADGAGLRANIGRFAVVEGQVVSVRRSGGTIYVNFGRRWSEALTVTITRRQEPAFAAAGLAPRTFEGRRLRVRGTIDLRNGPVIAAAGPEQIEFEP